MYTESATLNNYQRLETSVSRDVEGPSVKKIVLGAVVCASVLVAAAVIPSNLAPKISSHSIGGVDMVSSLGARGLEALSLKSDSQKQTMWGVFKHTYNKQYASSAEEAVRFEHFIKNLARIDARNMASPSATFGITEFADIDHEQFTSAPNLLETDGFLNRIHAGVEDGSSEAAKARGFLGQIHMDTERNLASVPRTFDWRAEGKVTPVKNIGTTCEATWAVAAVEDGEGVWAIDQDINAFPLSVQEVASCENERADEGCAPGGEPSHAYGFINHVNGLESESKYPLEISEGTTIMPECVTEDYAVFTNSASFNGWYQLPAQSAVAIKKGLAEKGPLAVLINRDQIPYYTGGIDRATDCDASHVNHGMLLVGYDYDANNEMYWILKGSYGSSWGENGYYKIYSADGACGIQSMVTHLKPSNLKQPRPKLKQDKYIGAGTVPGE